MKYLKYLSPSYLNIIVITLLSLLVVVVTVISTANNSQSLYVLLAGETTSQNDITYYHDFFSDAALQISNNRFTDGLPVTIFWMILGLTTYLIILSVSTTIKMLTRTKRELKYVHVTKRQYLKTLVTELLVRGIAGAILLVGLYLFFKFVLQYILYLCHHAGLVLNSATGILYSLEALILCILSFHIITVFLRFTSLKPRIFAR